MQLGQNLGYWVTCGVKMMSLLCHGWGWQPPQPLLFSISLPLRHIICLLKMSQKYHIPCFINKDSFSLSQEDSWRWILSQPLIVGHWNWKLMDSFFSSPCRCDCVFWFWILSISNPVLSNKKSHVALHRVSHTVSSLISHTVSPTISSSVSHLVPHSIAY